MSREVEARDALATSVRRAATPGASIDDVAAGARAIVELAAGGDDDALYQHTLLVLHRSNENATRSTRGWLASLTYPIEDARIPLEHVTPGRSGEEFLRLVNDGLSMRGRLGSAMAQHLFEGSPSIDDVRVYILHHWYRSRGFYRLLAEFALRLDLTDQASFYANLADEAGAHGTPAHPELLRQLVEHLGLPSSNESLPTEVEALTYLNNRFRCARHERPEWGLALLYALEHTTTETHRAILGMLNKLGLPSHATAFHTLHAAGDEKHAADMVPVILKCCSNEEGQRLFLTSLRRHQDLSRKYFERIWQIMKSGNEKLREQS